MSIVRGYIGHGMETIGHLYINILNLYLLFNVLLGLFTTYLCLVENAVEEWPGVGGYQ